MAFPEEKKKNDSLANRILMALTAQQPSTTSFPFKTIRKNDVLMERRLGGLSSDLCFLLNDCCHFSGSQVEPGSLLAESLLSKSAGVW